MRPRPSLNTGRLSRSGRTVSSAASGPSASQAASAGRVSAPGEAVDVLTHVLGDLQVRRRRRAGPETRGELAERSGGHRDQREVVLHRRDRDDPKRVRLVRPDQRLEIGAPRRTRAGSRPSRWAGRRRAGRRGTSSPISPLTICSALRPSAAWLNSRSVPPSPAVQHRRHAVVARGDVIGGARRGVGHRELAARRGEPGVGGHR